MAATPVWSRPYPFHCPSWTRSLRVTHELRGRQPQWLCSEFVPFLLLFDWQEAFHCCLVVTCINRINMISIQCHRVGEWWSGKPEFEDVSDPAGVYIPFKGLYYTLSHTYNAYIYVCSFPFFYCQIWFTIFFFWKLLCIALSVLQIYSAVCKLSLYTCQGYIHHVSFEGIHCLEKLFLSSKICLNIRNYLWNLRKWHYSV